MSDYLGGRRSNFGSFIVDGRGTILGFDQAMETLTGWPAVDVVGQHKNLCLSPGRDEPRATPIMTLPLYDGDIPGDVKSGNLELILHCRDGRRLDVETAVRPLHGPGDRLLIHVLRVLARSARHASRPDSRRRDPLTDLPDRDAFASRLAADFLSAASSASPLALILLDVDRLREINDRLGHAVGDDVLRKLADILRVSVQDEQRVARLGSDDFAILLPRAGRGDARQVAAGVRSAVERFRFHSDGLRVTVSLGAASYPADADSEKDLVERAREALDEARSMGRNRVWCYLRRPRVPIQVPVFFDGAEALLVGYTRDLSPSGVFVQTSASIDVGMRCALAFPLPRHEGRVHVVGRVVRTVPPIIDESVDHRVPGLGIEFERFGGNNDRRAIESFLHEQQALTLRPETGILSTRGPTTS